MSRIVLLASGACWAVMMAALVRREVLPLLEYQAPPTYRAIFRERFQPELELRGIFLGTERRGELETLFEPRPQGTYRTRTKLDLRVQYSKGDLPLSMRYEVNVDALYQLSDFSMTAQVMGMPLRAGGRRHGDRLAFTYDVGGLFKGSREAEFPKDMTLADGFLPFLGGARMAVGKKWRVQTLDLAKGDLAAVYAYASVERKEKKRWRMREVPTYVVEIRKNASDELPWHTLWVNEEGLVLVEEMTFDKLLYTMVLESKRTLTPEEAQAWEWRR